MSNKEQDFQEVVHKANDLYDSIAAFYKTHKHHPRMRMLLAINSRIKPTIEVLNGSRKRSVFSFRVAGQQAPPVAPAEKEAPKVEPEAVSELDSLNIPTLNPNSSDNFAIFWDTYGFKKAKKETLEIWNSLTFEEQKEATYSIPHYKIETRDLATPRVYLREKLWLKLNQDGNSN